MATRQRPKPPVRPTISGFAPTDSIPGREDLTIGAFIVHQIKAGIDAVNAAGVCGVMPLEFQAWLREGVRAHGRLTLGADWYKDLSVAEQDAVVFYDEVIRARSVHIARLTVLAERGAQGGLERVKRVTRTAGGVTVESTVTVETTLPDMEMIRWKLEKLEPQVYGSKATLNLTVTDMTDTSEVGDLVASRLEEIARAMMPDAIEAGEAVDSEPEP